MTTANTPVRPKSAIDAVADAYTEKLIELNPSFATTLGLPGHETEYQDYSPAGAEAHAEATRLALDALAGLEPSDDVDAVTLDAMRERLGLELEIHESGWDAADLNNIASPAQDIRAIFDLMPTDTVEQWEHIAGRAANVPGAIEGYIVSLRTAADAGKVAAARQVRIVIEQTGRYAAEDGFFAKMASSAALNGQPLPADVQDRLDAGTAAARSAYSALGDFLRDELLPLAPEKDAVGRERYALASRSFVGAQIDLEETYSWGVQELERLIGEQEKVAAQIKPGASIEEAKAILNSDPARQIKGTDALKAWMQELSDRAVSELADVHFDIPDVMKTLECMIAPTDEGGIYYTGPSDDFSRPGRMWWSVPAGEDTFTTWSETTTVFHEGVPGHHLQVATATYRRELLNNWRRNVCWVSGHGEGWALYAEQLMLELGYLKDPGDHMGMLDGQRMRAARVVFDIGVHLELPVPERWGTGTWTPEKGFDFLKANLDISEGQLQFEFTRYLGWPGQAPSYKVGQRLWEQIRAELEGRDGFDLKSFHSKALNIGSVGLDVLRRALLG
ncbi:DUF885 domain-containing protein [Paenarthrobacter nitroguajacolicus]|uniref:DUF885 domain-containing protein n=1 Tax=Paenarthrobacter nitroguajacolicus TaxID=211146 RepID=UPI00286040F6|nr:DUF885 domain-containing protein [Paenarthrobacter nitroguajacolicus]MDR6637641.1 uncharacterized protein (DUF885 family) [Paenarthrobacter nitroguajacolicus]